jgi:cob(I)alamin adenosyltransferase
MYLYSKKGDSGRSIIGKKKISKDNKVLDLLGELDELNSLIGVVKNYLKKYRKQLHQVQEDLFIIQANISFLLYPKFNLPKFNQDKVLRLESEINKIEKTIKLPNRFVIPGKEINSAWLHYLRAVVRRIERKIIVIKKNHKISPVIISYLNRLSSYFYALALNEVYRKKLKEDYPNYK